MSKGGRLVSLLSHMAVIKVFFKCDRLARTSKDLKSCPSALRQNLDKNPNLNLITYLHKSSQRIPKEFPKNSQRIPKKFPKNSKKSPQKFPKQLPKNSQKIPIKFPKISQDFENITHVNFSIT